MRFQDKVALVTGGGSGLGQAACLGFAREGAAVSVVDLDEAGGQRTVSMIGESGGNAAFFGADVTSSSDVQAAMRAAAEHFGALHVLYNNAGIGSPRLGARIDEVDEADWDRVLGVNLKGVFLCSKYGVPEIRRSGGGAIVNTASIAGIVALTTHAYCASKAAVIELTKTMAIELAKENIRVNAVAPGFIDTPLLRGARVGASETEQARRIEHWARQVPAGRIGQPEDIANAVLYLASDEASLVTGHTLVVDGAYTIV